MRIAVRGTRGERKWVGRYVRPWVIEVLAMYNDVATEDGCLRPLVSGGLYEQPAREWMALRLIRAAYADERERKVRDNARKSKRASWSK